MNLFNQGRIPVTLRGWSGATHKAPKHGETKVVNVLFEILLNGELASAIVPDDGEIKAVAYRAALDGSVRPFLRAARFALEISNQLLKVFAVPDIETPSITFDSVKFSKVVAIRVDAKNVTLQVRATIGPCGPVEYGFLGEWHSTQRFVDFAEAAPELPLVADEQAATETDRDEKSREVINGRGPGPRAVPKPIQVEAVDEPATEEGERAREVGQRRSTGKRKTAAPPARAKRRPSTKSDAEIDAAVQSGAVN